ncbi:uncharacterized protein LOC133813953 [Humulus lupulus]|uniref:uncharacterized protein LOC133813953 n=1 Tax=Humulus lupulus TaxID=3486 RepID=UPI002B40F950|nr:uncharacterized protein LOC133813953 [Humulus lupulus]
MLQGLELFSETSGLWPNESKSAVYCCGMKEQEVQRALNASGFCKSDMLFRYLGIPICSKRISSKECEILLEKMVQRIRVWSSRNISFAGRATLVNLVLLSIHVYWSQIVLLPKFVLKRVIAICRAFLWKGDYSSHAPGYVSWAKVCLPKNEGGLGFRQIQLWNIAAIGKYIWVVASKKDNLWVKWVHNVYIGEMDWWEYSAPNSSSWYWKQVVKIKEKFKAKVDVAEFISTEYSINKRYKSLISTHPKVSWQLEVWSRMSVPKHHFLLWLAVLQRVQTRERLFKIQVWTDVTCLVCGKHDETLYHLFFDYFLSRYCLEEIKRWLNWNTKAISVSQLMKSIVRQRQNCFRKQVYGGSLAAMVYLIWQNRNEIY